MTDSETANSTLIVGAGAGVGLAVARRFARGGGRVGLIARSPDRLADLSAILRSEGVFAAWSTADASRPQELRAAIRDVTDRIGPIDVLCFSPLPAVDLIKPVLETEPHDLIASLSLSVGGAAAAVAEIAPGMIARRSGSLLFTTGSGGVRPLSSRAASAVATTAETAYIALLHDALHPVGIRVAQLVIVGAIGPGAAHEPTAVAEALWRARDAADTADGPVTILG
jgi:NADP-dependent 3-hydroxy acid dehydrogenase YdfG